MNARRTAWPVVLLPLLVVAMVAVLLVWRSDPQPRVIAPAPQPLTVVTLQTVTSSR